MSKSKFNLFNFRIGKLKRPFSYYVKVGLILNTSIDLLSRLPGLNKKNVFNTIDRTQQFLKLDILNDYIIKDDKFIGYRIERVLDDAINLAERKYGD